jgi:diaminohydroxyphosphoribosylaminopyrimidine deaminase / 5-amino-6-(5-phosphoribosylamino)uracil reductase
MRLALDLAERARLTARPNPMVGAIVVKDGQIVGSGFHERPGQGHGEVEALADVPDDVAKGSTVYVNLEPCSFTGRTPPCCELLIDKQVARVVCAIEDPDKRVSGKGFTAMRSAGVEVVVGVLAEEAERLNAAYLKQRRTQCPYVTLKLAQSLDGSIATTSGDSKWITSPQARRIGHALRAEAQAIAVGVGTVLADDPKLSVRHVEGANPIKVVFDSQLRTPDDAKLLEGERCILFAGASASKARISELKTRGVDVHVTDHDRPDVSEVLTRLADEDVVHLLVEGGSRLAGSFLESGHVDRLKVFVAPKLLDGLRSIDGLSVVSVSDAVHFENVTVEQVGPDYLYTADVKTAV